MDDMTEQEIRAWAKKNGKEIFARMNQGDVLAKSVFDCSRLWLAIPDGFTHWFLEEAIEEYEKHVAGDLGKAPLKDAGYTPSGPADATLKSK